MNQNKWETIAIHILNELQQGEALAFSLTAEDSLFVRMTQAKVRQITQVQQGLVELNFFKNNKNLKFTVPFTFQHDKDLKACQATLQQCREEIAHLPEDLFLQLPQNYGCLHQDLGEKVFREPLIEDCLDNVQNKDFTGMLTAGEIVRANLNSAGLNQWFQTSTFCVDFSLYNQNQQAVKGLYGGRQWQNQAFENIIAKKLNFLKHLDYPLITLEKKKYRVYFSPAAVATLIDSLSSFGLVSQEAYGSGQSAFKKLIDEEKNLSSLLSLQENFAAGDMPRFNEMGEIAPETLEIVGKGRFKNLLCSSRFAKEYGVASNFATSQEYLRAPEILSGHLPFEKEIEVLGTGLYVSDLHYLNWSNVLEGNVTGMTRFGCFWVENGQIIAPVKDMRFDESLYHFWGQGLEGFTNKAEIFPKTGTYDQRELGSIKAPGMLVNDFTFVL